MHRATLILFLSAGEALAHPGHGTGGWLSAELLHLLSEPDHLAMILAPLVVGLVWIAWRAIKASSASRPCGSSFPTAPCRPSPIVRGRSAGTKP